MPGGKRPEAGRPKRSPNKATREVKDTAKDYTREAVTTLVSIYLDEKQPAAARVAAAREILDRGHGKAKQSVEHSGGNPLHEQDRSAARARRPDITR